MADALRGYADTAWVWCWPGPIVTHHFLVLDMLSKDDWLKRLLSSAHFSKINGIDVLDTELITESAQALFRILLILEYCLAYQQETG